MNKLKVLGLVAALAMLLIGGVWLVKHQDTLPSKAKTARKVLYWHDPMVPGTHFDKPGKSPFMDMDLVPVYADDQAADAGVTIDSRTLQNLGVRLAKASLGPFRFHVEAVGIVKADERRVQVVQSRQPGWIENLAVHAVGDPVRKGQALAEIYSPDIVAAEEELLLATKMQTDGKPDETLLSAARGRLQLFGLSNPQIARIEASGKAQRNFTLQAQLSGVVSEIDARPGAAVAAGAPLMTLTDLSSVWVICEVPETQSAVLKFGMEADALFAAMPGRIFPGKIDYVYPGLDTTSRTLKARLVLDNTDGALHPDMLARVILYAKEDANVLTVPSEAVIATGKRNVVIVAESNGRFRPVEIVAGRENGDRTEVLQGLQEGQAVVASGQFLIDSESSLKTMLKRFEPTPLASMK